MTTVPLYCGSTDQPHPPHYAHLIHPRLSFRCDGQPATPTPTELCEYVADARHRELLDRRGRAVLAHPAVFRLGVQRGRAEARRLVASPATARPELFRTPDPRTG